MNSSCMAGHTCSAYSSVGYDVKTMAYDAFKSICCSQSFAIKEFCMIGLGVCVKLSIKTVKSAGSEDHKPQMWVGVH